MKPLYIMISVSLDNKFQSLRKRSTALLTLANILLKWSSNVNLKSNMTPRCFWEKLWQTLLLKTKGGWVDLLDLQLKIISCACLLWSRLKLIFHWKAHSLTFFKSSFNSFTEVFTSWKTENNDVSSAKCFALEVKLSDKSFVYVENNNGPRIDPWGAPAWTLVHDEFLPLSTTFCFLLLKKSDKMRRSSPEMAF